MSKHQLEAIKKMAKMKHIGKPNKGYRTSEDEEEKEENEKGDKMAFNKSPKQRISGDGDKKIGKK